jgi:hypothetical protein
MDFYAEQILTIAFDESGDIVIEQDGNRSKAVANHAKVQRDRLKVDSLKWITSTCSLLRRQNGVIGPGGTDDRRPSTLKPSRQRWAWFSFADLQRHS